MVVLESRKVVQANAVDISPWGNELAARRGVRKFSSEFMKLQPCASRAISSRYRPLSGPQVGGGSCRRSRLICLQLQECRRIFLGALGRLS